MRFNISKSTARTEPESKYGKNDFARRGHNEILPFANQFHNQLHMLPMVTHRLASKSAAKNMKKLIAKISIAAINAASTMTTKQNATRTKYVPYNMKTTKNGALTI